jgi:hypothetical protein
MPAPSAGDGVDVGPFRILGCLGFFPVQEDAATFVDSFR